MYTQQNKRKIETNSDVQKYIKDVEVSVLFHFDLDLTEDDVYIVEINFKLN